MNSQKPSCLEKLGSPFVATVLVVLAGNMPDRFEGSFPAVPNPGEICHALREGMQRCADIVKQRQMECAA